MKKNIIQIYQILVLILMIFGCEKNENEMKDVFKEQEDVIQLKLDNKQEEVVNVIKDVEQLKYDLQSIDVKETGENVDEINETKNTFTPLNDSEIFTYEEKNFNGKKYLSIYIVNKSSNTSRFFKVYDLIKCNLFQSDDLKKIVLSYSTQDESKVIYINGLNGEITEIADGIYNPVVRCDSKIELICLFNNNDKVLTIYNTTLLEEIYKENFQFEDNREGFLFFSDFENRIIVNSGYENTACDEYNYYLSEDKKIIENRTYTLYEKHESLRAYSEKLIFPKLTNDEIICFDIIGENFKVYVENTVDSIKKELFSVENVRDIKKSNDNKRIFFIKKYSGKDYVFVVNGINGKVNSLLPCENLYQISTQGSFLLMQNTSNSVLLLDPVYGDIIRTYDIELLTEESKIQNIKYENGAFIVEVGNGTEIFTTKKIVLK